MKIPAIKHLVETQDPETLSQAEASLEAAKQPAIEVPGDDAGEQLTHVLGAIFVQNRMNDGASFTEAVREFGQKVRESIS